MITTLASSLTNALASSSSTQETAFPSAERYVLTQVKQQQLAFPSQWVAEIIRIEDHSRILPLPFYSPMILGIIHHQGSLVPLLASECMWTNLSELPKEGLLRGQTLSAIRLSEAATEMAGVALVVDQVINTVSVDMLTQHNQPVKLFELANIPSQVWHPQRWEARS
jgi:chemotaxis signal transduction protein